MNNYPLMIAKMTFVMSLAALLIIAHIEARQWHAMADKLMVDLKRATDDFQACAGQIMRNQERVR